MFSKLVLFTVTIGGLVLTGAAQRPDRTPKNLQYFPKDTPRAEIVSKMRDFSFALGVACTHCHGTEEQTGFSLRGVDFSLDIKPAKTKARAMLRMRDVINSSLLSKIPHRSDLNLEVTCFTCHSGLARPDKIDSRFMRKLEADGVEQAIEDYKAARKGYFGSAAYNFGEQPLVEVASRLQGEKRFKEAAAVSQLNLEFHPESGQSKYGLAEAYVGLGEKEKARAIYEELLKARPDDRRLKARIEALGDPE